MTPAEALESASSRLERNPSDPDAWALSAQALEQVGAHMDAVHAWRAALRQRPDWPDAWLSLGRVLATMGVRHEPEACYRKALRLDATSASARRALGLRLLHLGQLEEAQQCLSAVLQQHASDVDARAGLALCLHRRHDSTAAWALLQDAPATVVTAMAAAEVGPVVGEQEAADALVLCAAERFGTEPVLLHAQADVLTRQQAHDEAFEVLVRANEGRKLVFDPVRHQHVITAIIDAFADPPRPAPTKASITEPVFIVGMPRSGSTLVQSILTQHPDVGTAGERHALPELVTALGGYPLAISEEQRLAAVHYYRAGLGTAKRWMLDKMPNNALHLGLAGLLFPNARVIYVTRDPDETAWSCFRHAMAAGLPWATTLHGIASWTVGVQRLMAHWSRTEVLAIHPVVYEDLVRDPDTVIRQLLDFLSLPFDPACLTPERSQLAVNTLSANAVRRPIHTEAVRRSAPFQTQLGDLAALRAEYHRLATGK